MGDRARPGTLAWPTLGRIIPTYIRPHSLAGPNPSHLTPLPSATPTHLRRSQAFSGMASSGSDFAQSRSVEWGLFRAEWRRHWRFALHSAAHARTTPGRREDLSVPTPYRPLKGITVPLLQDHPCPGGLIHQSDPWTSSPVENGLPAVHY